MVPREAFIAVTMMSNWNTQRAWQHREGVTDGFAKKYGLKRLVWYGRHESMITAIQREESLKKYQRAWKISLIERDNPHWNDLYMTLVF